MFWTDLPPSLWSVWAVLLGLLFGSFLNVVIHRLPRQQSVVSPPSTCPGCGARIKPYDNIPVLSWIWLRGRARCCGTRIATRYPLVEALGGLLAWGVMQRLQEQFAEQTPLWLGLTTFCVYLALVLGLLAALFIDLDHMLLPDSLTLGGAALGLLSLPLRSLTWQEALLGGAVGFLIVWLPFDVLYRWLRGFPGMGLGDAKLLLLAGVWFGWTGAVFALLAGAVQGTLVAIAVYLTQGRLDEPDAVREEREALQRELETLNDSERQQLEDELKGDPLMAAPAEGLGQARLAFGPFLILAIYEFLFFEQQIAEWFFQHIWLV